MSTDLEFMSFYVGDQLLGIPVLQVQEILPPQPFTRVPLTPATVKGLLNLRGQIVTGIDLRERLGLPPRDSSEPFMNVIVSEGGELFSLLADRVGDVITVAKNTYAPPPPTLASRWKDVCSGVHRLKSQLLIVVEVGSLLNIKKTGS
ncbi:MAG TPA: chemotaxis protein CheW [Bdellovibrionales bacterium]|nr:chemotaxis protein CheW [Bdellovibrionales bacterium]